MRDAWEEWRLQFLVLYHVFFLRVIDLELLAADADPSRLMAQFANVFLMVSGIFSIPVLMMGATRTPMTGQWTAEHFFIETTITIGGLIAVLNWDAAFPDKRDVLVLGPLPVRASTLLLAKVSALCAAPGLAMGVFNVFIGVAWPLVFISRDHGVIGALRAWPAYWATILLGGLFYLFSILAVQGLAANLLPRQIFLRFSAVLQAAMLCLLLSVYFLEPSLETPKSLTAPENQRLLAWLPSYWFLGLFQQLNGSMHPALAPLARRAWIGLGVSAAGAGAAMLLSYFRMLPKIVEQPDIVSAGGSGQWSRHFGHSLKSAVTFFSLRTLLRSRQHRTILSFYVGIGLAMVLGYIETPFAGVAKVKSGISMGYLLGSLLLMILTVLALRVVVAIPITLRANWIMRVTQVRPARHYERAVRCSWIVLSVVPVVLVLAGGFLAGYPWRQMLPHLVAMLLVGMLLVEVCLISFKKISFTCSYLPGKANLHFVFWACLLFFIRWLKDMAELEGRLLQERASSLTMILVLVVMVVGVWGLNEIRVKDDLEMVFEEEDVAEMVSLKLS